MRSTKKVEGAEGEAKNGLHPGINTIFDGGGWTYQMGLSGNTISITAQKFLGGVPIPTLL
jgi:hypothetical protein